MANVVKYATHLDDILNDISDKRTRGWFLLDSIWILVFIEVLYLSFVKYIGPKLMANRKPFNIDKLLIIYNICQIFANAYIFYLGGNVIFRTFNYYCNHVDYSYTPNALTLLQVAYLYYLIKIVDLFDTVFFILRKKDNQVSFLHVCHHSYLVIVAWIFAKYYGGGHTVIQCCMNSFVHTCMYSYYAASVMNKKLKTNHFLKRRITEIQLLQFISGVFIAIGLFSDKSCKYPMVPTVIGITEVLLFFTLFVKFYVNSYLNVSKKQFKNGSVTNNLKTRSKIN